MAWNQHRSFGIERNVSLVFGNWVLPKETVGRVRAVLMLVLSNDDKQDENMTIKEDNDKDDNDTSIYNITKKKKNEMLVRVNSSWC